MDTVMEVTVYGSGASDAAEEAERAIRRLEELWSVTREDSDLARLNRGETVDSRRNPPTFFKRDSGSRKRPAAH